MEIERSLWDGDCLYDYTIIDSGDRPVLVIRDLNGTTDKGVHKTYWKVEHNLAQVIAEIGYKLERKLKGIAAIIRDDTGKYYGIDLLGSQYTIFPLLSHEDITDESEALSIVLPLHGKRKKQLADIFGSIPKGKIYQYSYVEISGSNGGHTSYYVSGYPQNADEIKQHEEYIRLEDKFPDEDCFRVEIVSKTISGVPEPIPSALLKKIEAYGFELIRNQENVEEGPAKRLIVIPGIIL